MLSREEFLKINGMFNPNKGCIYNSNFINDDRPLARFAVYEKCHTQLTGYVNKKKGIRYYKCNICNVNMNAKTTQRSVKIGLNDSFFQFLTAVELKSDYKEHFKMQIEKIFKYMNAEEIELQKNQKKREKELNDRLDKLERRYAFGDFEDKNLYEKFKIEIETELGEIARKNVNMKGDLSNQLKYMENVALVSQNLSKHWAMGNYQVNDKIQRAVFPEGCSHQSR